MIEPELAKKFIERLTQYTEYNINIMDESGVIIASRDPSRVGTYHEVADRIIHGEQDMIVIRDEKEFPGVLPGINMAITHQGRREGVIGVTGDPDRIHEVALITRLAMETMLRYEKQQEEIRLRRNRKEHFLNILTQKEFADSSELRGIARQLGLDESLVRVSIVCRLTGAISESGGANVNLPSPEEALEELRHGKGHWVQDFSAVLDETHLLVYKTVKLNGSTERNSPSTLSTSGTGCITKAPGPSSMSDRSRPPSLGIITHTGIASGLSPTFGNLTRSFFLTTMSGNTSGL